MKTNFEMMNELRDWFPKARGFITGDEANRIKETLEIEGRSTIDLRNLRDFTVMILNLWMDKTIKDEDWKEQMRHCDRMSAITAVIDGELFSRSEAI